MNTQGIQIPSQFQVLVPSFLSELQPGRISSATYGEMG
jgi:hypothetical protein